MKFQTIQIILGRAPRAALGALVAALALFPFFTEAGVVPSAYLADHAPRFIASIDENYGDIIERAGLRYQIDPALILALIVIESEGNKKALSKRGAHGLMQLMPQTARSLGVTDLKNPEQNIFAGTRYLRSLEDDYGYDDPAELLVAYNMGPYGAKRWLAHNRASDYSYVQKIMYVKRLVEDRAAVSRVAFGAYSAERAIASVANATARTASFESLKPLLTKPQTLALGTEIPAALSAPRLRIIEATD